ncbi:MAG: ferritin family protein, partial [Candidatus Margulisiibacteriota bacterium]
KVYAVDELLKFAIQIEEDGLAFYQKMSAGSAEPEVKALFTTLQEDEARHKKIFEELLAEEKRTEAQISFPDEYELYLKALVRSTVFPKDTAILSKLVDDAEIIEYAIGKEKDSILFYAEMKSSVADGGRLIEKIINEEKLHIIKLLDMKEKLG